jgi:hypothetical protein
MFTKHSSSETFWLLRDACGFATRRLANMNPSRDSVPSPTRDLPARFLN